MKPVQALIPAIILAAGLALSGMSSFAKPEYTKKEKVGCTKCHVTAKSKELNAAGKCYKDKKDLKACNDAK